VTPTPGVPDIIARVREMVGPALGAAVERLDPSVRRLASYHMGWTDRDGRTLDGCQTPPAGKGIRAALAVLSAEATWSDAAVGLPGAVALELVHNYSLIHDDIIDGDTERHHRPTVWTVFGVGPAIVVGDALQVLAHQVLMEAAPERGLDACAALAEATARMIAGQAEDIAFESQVEVSVEQCTAMCAAKTGALLGCAASIGALLAGAPPTTVGALRDYGLRLGLAFQAQDDLLGIWGDPSRTGKPAGSDLRQRKKSMPIVAALAAGGPECNELRSLISSPDCLDEAQVARAAYLVEACGGRQWTQVRAKANLDAALGALDQARLSALPRRQLADLATFVVEREW
jgi:geranylgeranyl diphosphate synthase type I